MNIRKFLVVMATTGCCFMLQPYSFAEPGTPDSASSENLDQEVQKLKEEILELNTQLFRLQEDLLYPEDSSIVVFFSLEGGHYFALDSVKLLLDDILVTSHLYTEREVEALQKGGVQRLFMGNLKSGPHQLLAIFTGTGPQQKDYKQAELLQVEKKDGAKFVKFTIRDDTDKKEPEFTHEVWE